MIKKLKSSSSKIDKKVSKEVEDEDYMKSENENAKKLDLSHKSSSSGRIGSLAKSVIKDVEEKKSEVVRAIVDKLESSLLDSTDHDPARLMARSKKIPLVGGCPARLTTAPCISLLNP